MEGKTIPFGVDIPKSVELARSPLERVIAQIQFPQILAIGSDETRVAAFQESLRRQYPYMTREVMNQIHGAGQHVNVTGAVIWRLADKSDSYAWRVSLGVDFIALETIAYEGRQSFLKRLRAVLDSLKKCFDPAEATRVGIKYIDRISGEAILKKSDLIDHSVLGMSQPQSDQMRFLHEATTFLMTHARFEAEEGLVAAQWGYVPADTTFDPAIVEAVSEASWVLDLDMSTSDQNLFEVSAIIEKSNEFAQRVYSIFRTLTKREFLNFFGGKA